MTNVHEKANITKSIADKVLTTSENFVKESDQLKQEVDNFLRSCRN